MAVWTDLDDTKLRVTIGDIIDHFGDGPSQDKPKYKISCPFHDDTEPSCAIDAKQNQWYCHGACKVGGDIHTYVALKQGMDNPNSLKSRRAACALIDGWFGIVRQRPAADRKTVVESSEPIQEETPEAGAIINPPYKYGELKSVDVEAGVAYAISRGLPEALARERGVAVAERGWLKGRLVIPLHDHHGLLLGYAGRALEEVEGDAKYLMPASKHGFYKSHMVYNLHRVLALEPKRRRGVVVVEGFFGCWAVEAAGLPCVALMGSKLHEPQARMLAEYFDHVVFLLDGDAAGRQCTAESLSTLGVGVSMYHDDEAQQQERHVYVRAVLLPDDTQPDHFDAEELQRLLRFER